MKHIFVEKDTKNVIAAESLEDYEGVVCRIEPLTLITKTGEKSSNKEAIKNVKEFIKKSKIKNKKDFVTSEGENYFIEKSDGAIISKNTGIVFISDSENLMIESDCTVINCKNIIINGGEVILYSCKNVFINDGTVVCHNCDGKMLNGKLTVFDSEFEIVNGDYFAFSDSKITQLNGTGRIHHWSKGIIKNGEATVNDSADIINEGGVVFAKNRSQVETISGWTDQGGLSHGIAKGGTVTYNDYSTGEIFGGIAYNNSKREVTRGE